MKMQSMNNRLSTTPIRAPRSNRTHTARGLTSLPAGKMVPIAAVPLLREDSIRSGRLRFSFESMETAEILMNAISVRVTAYLVPFLAMDRFQGSMDQLNRSYMGEPFGDNDVVPFIETEPFGPHGANDVYRYLGLHGRPNQQVNTMYLEAYNQIWNFRARNRSRHIDVRDRLDADLAPAFWVHDRFRHIVPDFDQAVIDGEVALNIADAKMPVKGIGPTAVLQGGSIPKAIRHSDGTIGPNKPSYTTANSQIMMNVKGTNAEPFADIYAELQDNGITVSLSNIEMARKTQAFAKLREQYNGHDDDYIINLLMNAISIPEQAFAQPMLIGDRTTVFGMSKRYASDSGNLTESVVNGATFVDLAIQLPRISTGGVVMIMAEVTPDQLFERQKEPFLHTQSVEEWPQFLRDTLDPEKVQVVPNEYIDIDHDTPNATFGYAPLNYAWQIEAPHIGGRFYRPAVDAGFDEDRQRIWAVETANPTLSTDFYLCTNIHTKPFVVSNQDPFECITQGDFVINGNTVFGGVLHEATDDYDKVLEQAPQDRIEKD